MDVGIGNNFEFWLPKLIGSGMVLQRESVARLWGRGKPNDTVKVLFLDRTWITTISDSGHWLIELKNLKPGGPYNLYITTLKDSVKLNDVYIGDVWLMSGQSNMELTIARVKDEYPINTLNLPNPMLRYFKVKEAYDFNNKKEDVNSIGWITPKLDNILDISALSYFFESYMAEASNVPVGIINVSLGGTPIESWIDELSLKDDKDLIKVLNSYKINSFTKNEIKKSDDNQEIWHKDIDKNDNGLNKTKPWYLDHFDTDPWNECTMPDYFQNIGVEDFSGSIWFTKSFNIPKNMLNKEVTIWLGTLVDSDETFINGVKVGETGYLYPPRKYIIPKNLLREINNSITIRIKCNNGMGRFTPDKDYKIFTKNSKNEFMYSVPLNGKWKYKIGYKCEPAPVMDFIIRKPTGLYNGMLYPCKNFSVCGFIWYQGESNTDNPENYKRHLEQLIGLWREIWNLGELPFLCVQLPNFSIDLNNNLLGWPRVRDVQRRIERLNNVRTIVAIDLGFYNELHPTNKKTVAYRLSLIARKIQLKEIGIPDFPILDDIKKEPHGIRVSYKNLTGNLDLDPKSELFYIRENSDDLKKVSAVAEGKSVFILTENPYGVTEIRYAYENSPCKGLLTGDNGLPASPFSINLD